MKHKAEILEYLETRASQLREQAGALEHDADWADSGPARASILGDAREARSHAIALCAEARWLKTQE